MVDDIGFDWGYSDEQSADSKTHYVVTSVLHYRSPTMWRQAFLWGEHVHTIDNVELSEQDSDEEMFLITSVLMEHNLKRSDYTSVLKELRIPSTFMCFM